MTSCSEKTNVWFQLLRPNQGHSFSNSYNHLKSSSELQCFLLRGDDGFSLGLL